jgi:putative membrane protein
MGIGDDAQPAIVSRIVTASAQRAPSEPRRDRRITSKLILAPAPLMLSAHQYDTAARMPNAVGPNCVCPSPRTPDPEMAVTTTGSNCFAMHAENRCKRAIGMADSSTPTIPGRFDVKATASDHFSWLRTRLSLERTMMSWVRTATALIAFGFTIVQFFARIQETPGVTPAYFPSAPRYLGLSLIFCGVMALVISIWEYHWGLRYLWSQDFAVIAGATREGKQTPLLAVAVVLALIGVFAFFAVLFRLV